MAIQPKTNVGSIIRIEDSEQAGQLLQWMDALPSEPLSGALTVTVIVQQQIELIRKEQPTVTQGNPLSDDIVQSKGFPGNLQILTDRISSSQSDILPYIDPNNGPIREFTQITDVESTVNKVDYAFVLVCPNIERRESLREGMKLLAQNIQQLIEMETPFLIEGRAQLDNRDLFLNEPRAVEQLVTRQEGTVLNEDLLADMTVPHNSHACSVYSWKFEEGEKVSTTNQVSFAEAQGQIIGTRSQNKAVYKFVDLTEESEDWWDLET